MSIKNGIEAPTEPSMFFDDEVRALRPRGLRAGFVAFGWVFFSGLLWMSTAQTSDQSARTALLASVATGFAVAFPGFLLAVVTFYRGAIDLLRGKPASLGALLLSAGAVGAALLMDFAVWNKVLDQLYPVYFAHGRRLHRGRKILSAASRPGHGWTTPNGPLAGDLAIPPEAKAGVAAQWRENAAKEHASIAAFAQLTLDLLAVGAPAHLISSAQQASLDEVGHAEVAYALAKEIDGLSLVPAPFPEAHTRRALSRNRPLALAQIAVDALADGALNEGMASRLLVRLSKCSATPELSRLLKDMATDEAKHARDSWDVVEWCLEEGGELVHRALSRAAERMPDELGSPLPEAARDGAWSKWGVQGVALEQTEYVFVRRLASARLEAMLATFSQAKMERAA